MQLDDLKLAHDRSAGRRTHVALAIEDEQLGLDSGGSDAYACVATLDANPLALDTRRFGLGLAGGSLRLTDAGDTAGADGETADPIAERFSVNLRTNMLDARA